MIKIGKGYDLCFCYLYLTDGLGWVRFWWLGNAGFHWKDITKRELIFSERNGKKKMIKIGNYRFIKLKGK